MLLLLFVVIDSRFRLLFYVIEMVLISDFLGISISFRSWEMKLLLLNSVRVNREAISDDSLFSMVLMLIVLSNIFILIRVPVRKICWVYYIEESCYILLLVSVFLSDSRDLMTRVRVIILLITSIRRQIIRWNR